jgi:hypothetical protein
VADLPDGRFLTNTISTGEGMHAVEVPRVIESYQLAHDNRDTANAIACFDADATVIDEDTTYTGTEHIHWWLDNGSADYTYTRTQTGAEQLADDVFVVTNHLSGDFPGGDVDLRHRYQLRDGLIHRLEIAP